jgi:hypothetical protein
MKKSKTLLIGINALGVQAVNKLIASGVTASTLLVHDDDHTQPDALSFKFVQDDPESMKKLQNLFVMKTNNIKLDVDDLVFIFVELGDALSTTITTLMRECENSGLDLAVMGVVPNFSNKFDEATKDEFIQDKNWCRYLMEFPLDTAIAELNNPSKATTIDYTIDAICHVTETMINGKMIGYYRASDMESTNYLPYILGIDISISNILIGKGKDSESAFKDAVSEHNETDYEAVAFSVTGDPEAIEETIERAVDFFGVERLWMTHRLADTETVQVTMMVA